MPRLDLLIIGPTGNTHVASSLMRAATALGFSARLVDTAPAYEAPALIRKVMWRLNDRKPVHLTQFSKTILDEVAGAPPRVLIAMGQVPVRGTAIALLRHADVHCVNYATDDPFNPAHRSAWHLDDLRSYDAVCSPRRANLDDFVRHGCRSVRYVPFAYDEQIIPDEALNSAEHGQPCAGEILFVGGADRDRVQFFSQFVEAGLGVRLVGAYWERHQIAGAVASGTKPVEEVRRLTRRAAVNICLVRRANRDGHVMRSFEIAAAGGFMIAEDTQEHREIFGKEGDGVLYFATPQEAAEKTAWALQNSAERQRMAKWTKARIRGGAHTYCDRLKALMQTAEVCVGV